MRIYSRENYSRSLHSPATAGSLGMTIHDKANGITPLLTTDNWLLTPGYRQLVLNPKLALHLFQRNALGFGESEQHDEEHQGHHGGKEHKRISAAEADREIGKDQRDNEVHDPVRRAAQALSLRAHAIGKHFADIDPDDSTLRNREECD